MTEKEFNTSILPLAKHIYSFALNLTGNPADASDITQDVMYKLWDDRKQLKKVNNPKAWALKMTRNLYLDNRKKHKPVYDEKEMLRQEYLSSDPQRMLENKDTAETVRRVVEQLPPTQREVVKLRELEELEYTEIAHITGLGLNNIRVLLSRARTKIKEILVKTYQISPYEE